MHQYSLKDGVTCPSSECTIEDADFRYRRCIIGSYYIIWKHVCGSQVPLTVSGSPVRIPLQRNFFGDGVWHMTLLRTRYNVTEFASNFQACGATEIAKVVRR